MPADSSNRFDDSTAAQQRFLSLFLRSEREIFRYVAALVPNVTDAEDIVQQTALALWEKFDAYDPAQPFTPWACRFALNKARQWIERRQRWQALLDHGLAEELAQRRQELQPEFERRLKHLEDLPRQAASRAALAGRGLLLRAHRHRIPGRALRQNRGRHLQDAATHPAGAPTLRGKPGQTGGGMTLSFPSPEFDDAVAAVCHGSATEAEMRALNELLRSDPSARDEYLFRVELHARLASDAGPLFAGGRDGRRWCARRSAVSRTASLPALIAGMHRRPARRRWQRRRCWRWRPACAPGRDRGLGSCGSGPPATGNGATSTAVAMLTRAVDARWGAGAGPLRVGSALEPGWLRLESGLAQVVFYSGARVVIEGPAELQLVSPERSRLSVGTAAGGGAAAGARLPPEDRSAHAWWISGPRSGSTPPAAGPKSTSSREGGVVSGAAAKQSLGGGQAAVVQGGAPPRLMAANAAAFTPMFEFQQRSLASEAFRYEQWQFASARLNQDPSLLVRLDFENLSGTDWTLRNAAEKNRSVPEATVVGCQRGEGRWREKQALEFQSVNDRVRLAVPGEFDALTLSAWVCVKGLDRQFNSLFMCDGFEPGTLHWLIRNDGVLGLTVVRPGTREVPDHGQPSRAQRSTTSACGCTWPWCWMARLGTGRPLRQRRRRSPAMR